MPEPEGLGLQLGRQQQERIRAHHALQAEAIERRFMRPQSASEASRRFEEERIRTRAIEAFLAEPVPEAEPTEEEAAAIVTREKFDLLTATRRALGPAWIRVLQGMWWDAKSAFGRSAQGLDERQEYLRASGEVLRLALDAGEAPDSIFGRDDLVMWNAFIQQTEGRANAERNQKITDMGAAIGVLLAGNRGDTLRNFSIDPGWVYGIWSSIDPDVKASLIAGGGPGNEGTASGIIDLILATYPHLGQRIPAIRYLDLDYPAGDIGALISLLFDGIEGADMSGASPKLGPLLLDAYARAASRPSSGLEEFFAPQVSLLMAGLFPYFTAFEAIISILTEGEDAGLYEIDAWSALFIPLRPFRKAEEVVTLITSAVTPTGRLVRGGRMARAAQRAFDVSETLSVLRLRAHLLPEPELFGHVRTSSRGGVEMFEQLPSLRARIWREADLATERARVIRGALASRLGRFPLRGLYTMSARDADALIAGIEKFEPGTAAKLRDARIAYLVDVNTARKVGGAEAFAAFVTVLDYLRSVRVRQ